MSDTPFYPLGALGLGVAPTDGVLRRADAGAMAEAGQIITRAREEAARIAQEAATAFEAEKQRGFDEGMAEAARQAAASRIEDHAHLNDALDALESDVAELVLGSVKQVLRSFDDETLSREVVRSALAAMRSEKRAQLHVAPSAYHTVKAAMADLLTDYPEIELVDVITDPDLTPPNLRLESSLGVVDFSLDNALDDLRRLLGGG